MAECSTVEIEEVKITVNGRQDPEVEERSSEVVGGGEDVEQGSSNQVEEGEIVRGKDEVVHQLGYVFDDQATCGSCVLKEDAIAYCKQCEYLLCDDCLGFHRKQLATKEHEIEESPRSEEIRRRYYCQKHNQDLDYFCEDCMSPICQDCFVTDCVEHKRSLAKDVREEMTTLLNGVRANMLAFREYADFIQKVMVDSEEAVHHCTRDVNEAFDDIIKKLEEKRGSVLSFLKEKAVENVKKNEEQKTDVCKIINGMENTIKDAENLLKTRKASKLMVNKITTCANLEGRAMQAWEKKFAVYQAWQLEHEEEDAYATKYCRLIPKPRPKDIIVGGLVSQEPRVGLTNTFTVTVNNFADQLQAFDEQTASNFLSVQILFEHNKCPGTSTTVRHRTQREDNKWTVTYFLRGHGTVTISLFMCGEGVENQPFTLQTNRSRVELHVDDRVIRGPDWKWENQDGGDGNQGTVTKINDRGWATVQWDRYPSPKKRKDYRWGAEESYDLKVIGSARNA